MSTPLWRTPVKVQVLTNEGCENGVATLALMREIASQLAPGVHPECIVVETPADAERLGFPGSPNVRVNGLDIDPDPPRGIGLG